MATLDFDATNVPVAEALEPIPAGWVIAKITESEHKPNSKNDGAFLALVLEIVTGPFAGRKLFDRLNLQNPNTQAVEIAYKTLSAIAHAVNVIQVKDSQQLHNLPMQVKVSLKPAGPGNDGKMYDAQNEIKGYKPLDPVTGTNAPGVSGPPGVSAAKPGWTPPTPAVNGNGAPPASPPWAGTAPVATPPPALAIPAVAPAPPPVALPPVPPAPPPAVVAAPPPTTYAVGQIVNGHRFTGTAWEPLPPEATPPPAGPPNGGTPPWARPAGT